MFHSFNMPMHTGVPQLQPHPQLQQQPHPQLQQQPQFQPQLQPQQFQHPQLPPPQFQPQSQFQPQPQFQQPQFQPQPQLQPQPQNLALMSQSFMPMNTSGVPQLQPQLHNLVQSFQQQNQAQRGAATQQLSWALTKVEKKSYDNIFRQWVKGDRFMSGPTAIEVFGASGLSKDDLAQIWTLADIDDRGKLNLEEFHVAMGLIYRRLNGMQLPDQLPRELIPSSRQDLGDTVDRVKELLERESRTQTHSPSSTDSPMSILKNRSFYGAAPSFESNRDATIYKHTDEEPTSVYKPKWRHVDRDAIRSRDDEDNPIADLQDLKRRVANTAHMLDRTADADAQRTKEDEELAREMSDLNYRVKRIQEDLDFNSRGTQTSTRANERRRLERELLSLMHERIPEVERKIKDREERKERDRRQWARDRDGANDRFGRYDSRDDYSRRDDRNRPYSRAEDRDTPYEDRSRPYSRAGDRPASRVEDTPYARGAGDREDRDTRDRNYDRPRSPPPPTRSAPRPPSAAATASTRRDTPPVQPQASPPPSLAAMTPEQRKAYTREQAKLRIQERMTKLGVISPSTSSTLDTSVEDRLQQEKKEAEEKAKAAEKQAEERERTRRERVENAKALKEGRTTPGVPTTPTPTSTFASAVPPVPKPPAPTPTKTAPPPPKPRARNAPPPPVRAPVPTPSVRSPSVPISAPRVAPSVPTPLQAEPEVDPEEEKLRAREEAVRKAREAREKARRERERKLKEMEEEEERARQEQEREMEQERARQEQERVMKEQERARLEREKEMEEQKRARQEQEKRQIEQREKARQDREREIRELEEQEAAATRLEEEQFQQRMEALKVKATSSKPATTSPSTQPVSSAVPIPAPSTPALLFPQSSASAQTLTPGEKSTNPFSRLLKEGTPVPTTPANDPNPWAKPLTTPLSIPSPSPSPAPMSSRTSYQTAPSSAIDDDWEDIKEKDNDDDDDDDSSNGDELMTRSGRADIARALFGNIRRPASATPTSPAPTSSPPVGVDSAAPPPPPPPALVPPPPVSAVSVPPTTPPAGRSALFSAIQGGKALRPTKTTDKSGPALSGKVLGDTAPPSHINAMARLPSPPPAPLVPALFVSTPPKSPEMGNTRSSKSDNRQSVGWFGERAADLGGSPVLVEKFPSTFEVDELNEFKPASIPDVLVDEHPDSNSSLMADIDKSTVYRTRSLFDFEGEGQEDLSFDANVMIIASPSKSGGDWWYGKLVTSGKSGLFPKTWVEEVDPRKARAVYSYSASKPDELSFSEGDRLDIVDTAEEEWWKAEQGGRVFMVPAGYMELVEG